MTWIVINAFQDPPEQCLLCAGAAPAALGRALPVSWRWWDMPAQVFPSSFHFLAERGQLGPAMLCSVLWTRHT